MIEHPAIQRKNLVRREASLFNLRHPVGTPVRYWPLNDRQSGYIESITRSEAWVLGDHTAVVLIEGRSGCVALSHIAPIGGDA